MKAVVKESIYKPWGRVLELSDGVAEMKVTLDIGPRIIYYALIGGPNLMYEDIKGNITKSGAFFDKNFDGKKWRIIGGHRLWKSPEDIESYYPDQEKVNYSIVDNVIHFASKTETTTGIKKVLSVKMLDGGRFRIGHEFINKSKKNIKVALWALTVLREGGELFFLTNQRKSGFLPTQNIVLWPYTDLNDTRLTVYDNYIKIKQDKLINKPFKLGAFLQNGVAVYQYKEYFFTKKFASEGELSNYPDFGCNFEAYTNEFMIECETLSKFVIITPEESALHYEDWEIKFNKNDVLDVAGEGLLI